MEFIMPLWPAYPELFLLVMTCVVLIVDLFVSDDNRIRIEPVNDDFKKVTITYGFMESPNLPKALGQCRKLGLKYDIMATSFFLGRRSIIPSAQSGMPLWQDKLFIFLMRNAANPTDFYKIPPGRVVEMGAQVTV